MDDLDNAEAKKFVEKALEELKDLRLRVRRLEAEKVADRELVASLKLQLKDCKRENLCLKDDLSSHSSELKRGNFIISQISKEYDDMKVSEAKLSEKVAALELANSELYSKYTTDIRKNQDEFMRSIEVNSILEKEIGKLTGYVCHLERELNMQSLNNQSLKAKHEIMEAELNARSDLLRGIQKYFIYAVTFCKSQSESSFNSLRRVAQTLDPMMFNMGDRGGIAEIYDDSRAGGDINRRRELNGDRGDDNDIEDSAGHHKHDRGGNSNSNSNSNKNNLGSRNNNSDSKHTRRGASNINSPRLASDSSSKVISNNAKAKANIEMEYFDLFGHLRELTAELLTTNEKIKKLRACNISLKDVIHTYDATWSIIDDTSKAL